MNAGYYDKFSAIMFVLFHVIIFLDFLEVSCQEVKSREGNCLDFLPKSYNRHMHPPPVNGKPTDVFMQIQVLHFDEINEETMDFRLHAYIRAIWNDPRIVANATDIHEGCIDYIWIPDLIFQEAKEIKETGEHNNRLVEIDGYFYFSRRYSFKVACLMHFHRYPFDTQFCSFTMSCMYTDNTGAALKWFDDIDSPFRNKTKSVTISKDIDPLQFVIKPPVTSCVVQASLLSNFTYLLANFILDRRLTGSIVNYYMPSALLVVMSWITFWLKEDSGAERVSLTMTALLTICTQCAQYKAELPSVNYITAMDIWYFFCISMLFAALLEFAFVYNRLQKSKEKMRKNLFNFMGYEKCPYLSAKHKFLSENANDQEETTKQKDGDLDISQKECISDLDSICKVLFPGLFLTFTIIYWLNYTEVIPLW